MNDVVSVTLMKQYLEHVEQQMFLLLIRKCYHYIVVVLQMTSLIIHGWVLSPALASLPTLVIPSSGSWDGTYCTQERDSEHESHYADIFVIIASSCFLYLDSSGNSS